MTDHAVGIRFVSDRTEGLGARFDCDTRIGPFSLTDVMEITEWEEDLTFPWYMGGPVAAFVAHPILRFVWKRNLARLKERLETV